VIMLGEPLGTTGNVESHVHVYVPDVDSVYSLAIDAGAVSVQKPEKENDPDRRCGVKDGNGVTWWIATQAEG
jgi:PhnB protein